MENEYIYYETSEEVVESVKKEITCDKCKFCYTWKNDGRWYRCENDLTKQNGIDEIKTPYNFGCINFEKLEEESN